MINVFASAKSRIALTLGGLIVLAVGLRLWGVDWPSLHPDEWSTRIVRHFYEGNFYYPHKHLWHHLMYIVLALFYYPVDWVISGVVELLGPAGASSGGVDLLLYGRVMICLMGGLNVWALYRLFKRLHDSTAGALAAAAIFAVSPLLVAQSHYHTVDAPLALAVTFALWSAVYMYQDGGLRSYLVAGLVFGLAVTTKVNAIIIIGSYVLAHVLAILERRSTWTKWALVQPGLFAGGGLVGLILGNPGFILDSRNFFENFLIHADKWVKPRYGSVDGFMDTPLGDRITWALGTISDAIGWEIVILFALGLGIAIWQRKKALWVVASFPFIYFFPYLLVANRMAERDMTPLVPALICLAAYAVVFVSERLTPKKAVAWVVGLATLALMFTPLTRSLRTSYVYWQGDTRHQARDWMIDTMPRDSVVFTAGYAPTDFGMVRAKYLSPKPEYYRRPHAFLIDSSLQEDREYYSYSGKPRSTKGVFMSKVPGWFQEMKVFDLKAADLSQQRPGRRLFPIFASPVLTIYSGHPKREIVQPLPLVHPTRRASVGYLMSYTNHTAYSLDDAGGFLSSAGKTTRTLRTPVPLALAEVELINLGHRVSDVKFSQGPWQCDTRKMHPGQIWRNILEPVQWPWFMERVYPFSMKAYPEMPILMRVVSDPLVIGWRALERSDFKTAVRALTIAQAKNPKALMPRALLAAAYLHTDRAEDAAELLRGQEEALTGLAKLAASDTDQDKWLKDLAAFTGYYPDLLMAGLTRRYSFAYPPMGPISQKTPGPGYTVTTSPPEGDNSTAKHTLFQLHDYFPPRAMNARLTLAWKGAIKAGDLEKVVVEMVGSGPGSPGLRFSKTLSASELASPTGRKVVRFAVKPTDPAQRWRLRLSVTGQRQVRVESLSLGLDPRVLLRDSARWALYAAGRVLLAGGQKAKAADVLAKLAAFDPGFVIALPVQVEALQAAGRKPQADMRLEQALKSLDLREDLLTWGVEAAAKLGAESIRAAYERKLSAFKAQEEVGALFSNGMRLDGYSISARKVRPGEELKLRLVWRFDQRPQRNIAIFTHLVMGGGVLNYDHLLDQGRLRMDRRHPGEVVAEEVVLKISPKAKPGRYVVEVGLYWGKKRIRVTRGPGKGQDILRLGEVEVEAR